MQCKTGRATGAGVLCLLLKVSRIRFPSIIFELIHDYASALLTNAFALAVVLDEIRGAFGTLGKVFRRSHDFYRSLRLRAPCPCGFGFAGEPPMNTLLPASLPVLSLIGITDA